MDWMVWKIHGSDVKTTFVQGVSAKDEVSRDILISRISMRVRERRPTRGARPGGGGGGSRGKDVRCGSEEIDG